MKTVTRVLLAAAVLLGSAQLTAAQAAVDSSRRPLDARDVVGFSVVIILFSIPMSILALYTWFEHRSRVKALDVLRVYAERNEEPPASVTQALTGINPHIPQAPPKPTPTRGHHLAHVAANVVFVLGAIGILWWKAPDPSHPGGFVIFVILAGLFFAAGAAARLVGAIYARE